METPSPENLEGLVPRSNKLGGNRAWVNEFGGNTSARLTMTDHMGKPCKVIAVKASGSDILTITEPGFALLRLEELRPLLELDTMSDEDMTAYLARTVFEPGRPKQSIETLLHAFTMLLLGPDKCNHVDHTHPDAIISIACLPNGREVAEKLFGKRMVWVDYIRPGFDLSKQIALAVEGNPEAEMVIMGKHGLVTWGTTSDECYANTSRIIKEAEAIVAEGLEGKEPLGELAMEPLEEDPANEIAEEVMPIIRGSVSKRSHAVLRLTRIPTVLDYVCRAMMHIYAMIGSSCPDHLVHVKHWPLVIDWRPSQGVAALKALLPGAIEDYARRYTEYFERNKSEGDVMGDPYPRVILIPGFGMVTTGKDWNAARLSADLYERAIAVITGAVALGGFVSLTELQAFLIEYWALEQYKLKLKPAPKKLAGQVAFVTGAGSGIGRATALQLASQDCHVVVCDIDRESAEATAREITQKYGNGRALVSVFDVTNQEDMQREVKRAIRNYGGIDILVNNAGIAGAGAIGEITKEGLSRMTDILQHGYILVGQEIAMVQRAQGIGGSQVWVASKNAVKATSGAMAYNTAKAGALQAALCFANELAKFGIRVNSVLPDAVIRGSSIWDRRPEGGGANWKEQRAAAKGIKPEDVEAHYAAKSPLGLPVYPEDVADAVAYLVSAAKTTGEQVAVDSGTTANFG